MVEMIVQKSQTVTIDGDGESARGTALKRLLAKLSLMSAQRRLATSTPNGCLMFVSC